MEIGRRSRTLRRFIKIKPGEEKLAFLLFSYFFLIAAPHTIINALRTTHFLWREGVGALPEAYLSAVVITGLVVFLYSKVQLNTSIPALITSSLVFFAVSGIFLQWVLRTRYGQQSHFISFFYWTWASVLIVVLITGFWTIVNEIYNPREAKRLIGFLNTGGILGGVVGGLLVGFLSETFLGVWLMPLACAMLFGSIFVVRAIFVAKEKQPPKDGLEPAGQVSRERRKAGFMDSLDAVRKDRFLSLIAVIVAIGVIVSTCIEFQFLSASFLHYSVNQKALQSFFGFFEPALTVFALFLNFLMAGYFLRKLDAAHSLLLNPAVILACSLAILLTPFGLLSGIFIRGSDESLTFSVSHPIREILYIPVPAPLRHKAKAFIEMFVSQFAKVVGALVLLAFALLLNKPVQGYTPVFDPGLAKYLSWVIIAFLIPWAFFNLKIGKEYLATLKGNIKPLWDRAERDLTKKLDVEYAKLIFDTIDSRNWSSVLYALHIFDLLARDKLSPDIKKIIEEKSGEVRATALADRFAAGGAAQFPEIPDELRPEDILTEIPLIVSSDDYQQVMQSYLDKVLAEKQDSEVHKMELAKVIGLMSPASPLADRLTGLIDDASPRVSCFALKSAARLKRAADIPAIIRKLGNFVTLEDAVDALHNYGDAAIGALEENLHDASKAMVLRMAVVEVLARTGTRRAVLALMEELEHGDGGLEEVLIDALDRVRAENPEIPLSAWALKKKTCSFIKRYCQTFIDIQSLGPGEETAMLRQHLDRNLEVYFAEIFKLLGLYYPQEDIRTAYQNIRKGTRNSVANAIEWLDNALKKDLKDSLLPIVEDLDPVEKKARIQKVLKNFSAL
ncbi:MAG: Npt1/Npt2 family nucleotide transporter [Candidatus Aminicenantales bacterium]|jgi:AAA family ATP:ADP antiporter